MWQINYLHLFTAGLCALGFFLQMSMAIKWEGRKYVVKNESVQIAPGNSQRKALIIRNIEMENGDIFVESWQPYVNENNEPDLWLISSWKK